MADTHTQWDIAGPRIYGKRKTLIATIAYFRNKDDEAAISALISAAPDLLKALQGVLRVADRKTDEFDAARAAISKATGKQQ